MFTIGGKDRHDKLNFQLKIVGREKEIAQLKEKYEKLNNNEPSLVLLSGKSGLGKSKLVNSLREDIADENVDFFVYQASKIKKNVPYAPFIEIIKIFFELRFSKEFEADFLEKVGHYLDLLSGVFPILKEKFIFNNVIDEGISDQSRKQEFYNGFVKLIEFMGGNHKTVLVLDDLQWLDVDSKEILSYLSKNIKKTKVMIITTVREEEHDKQFIENNKQFHHIQVNALKKDQIPVFINSILNTDVKFENSFYKIVYENTLGNPFFILEIMKALHEKKIIFFKNNLWNIDNVKLKYFKFDNDVSHLLDHRLQDIAREEKEILSIASIIGKDFKSDLINEIITKETNINDFESVLMAIDHGVKEQLIEENIAKGTGFYHFIHDKIIEALQKELDEERQHEIHLLCANILEEKQEDNEEHLFAIAYHYNHTQQTEKKLYYNDLAYKKAISQYSLNEAVFYMQKIADYYFSLESFHQENCNFILKFAEYLQSVGKITESFIYLSQLLEIVQNETWIQIEISIYIRLGIGYQYVNNANEAIENYQKALNLAQEEGEELKIAVPYIFLGNTYFSSSQLIKSKYYFSKAIEYADEADLDTYILLKAMRYYTYYFLGEIIEAGEDIKYVEENIDKISDLLLLSRLNHFLSLAYSWSGHLDEALEKTLKAYDLAKKSNFTMLQYASLWSRMLANFLKNEISQVKIAFDEAIQISNEKNISTLIEAYWSLMAFTYIANKEIEKAHDIALKYIPILNRITDKFAVIMFLNIQAIYFYYSNDNIQCKKVLEEAYQLYRERELGVNGIFLLQFMLHFYQKTENYKQVEKIKKELDELLTIKPGLSFLNNKALEMIENIEEGKEQQKSKDNFSFTSSNLKERLQLKNMMQASQLISSVLDINELIELVLVKALEVTRAERGALLLYNDDGENRYILKNIDKKDDDFKVIQNVFEKVNKMKKGFVISANTVKKLDPEITETIISSNILSTIATPLILKKQIIGILYLDSQLLDNLFTEEDLLLLEIFTAQAAISVDNAHAYHELEERVIECTKELSAEKVKSNQLLLNILPKQMADEHKNKGKVEPVSCNDVTVMFTDFKGFTEISENLTPKKLISELDNCFSVFDEIIEKYQIEKLKTIGDSYMCASGILIKNDDHAVVMVLAALEIQELMEELKKERQKKGLPIWELRFGIHTGPIVAGVVGQKKITYDIWGETVNTASRMKSSGLAGKINITEGTQKLVDKYFMLEYRGEIDTKYKGEKMYLVKGIRPRLSLNGDCKTPNVFFNKMLVNKSILK